jgi:glycosyltransferase involved in cell wall biosynthesis
MLSIIIPTKNRAKLLETLLPLLLSNDCPAEKILIGNDGSSDHTQEVINRYIKNKKLTSITNPISIGGIATNCKLLQHVNTKYFMFISDDDYFDNHLIRKLLNGVISTDAVCGFGKYRVENQGNFQNIIHPGWIQRTAYQSDFLSLLAHDHYIFGAIFQRSSLPQFKYDTLLQSVPFDLGLNDLVKFDNTGEFRAHDWDLSLSVAMQFPSQIYFLDEYVATFRKVDGQLSSDENYQFTGRAAFEMSLLLLKYLSKHEIRTLLKKNPSALEQIIALLNHKINQIKADGSHMALEDYLPVISAASALLGHL